MSAYDGMLNDGDTLHSVIPAHCLFVLKPELKDKETGTAVVMQQLFLMVTTKVVKLPLL